MTEDQNKEFDLLQLANDMSYANWQTLRYLYNEKFREAEKRNKELESALDDMAQYVSRADWHYIKPETRAALGEKK